MTAMRARAALAGMALTVLSPAVAWSCPVCFAGSSERVLSSYVLTAGLMTSLPLLIAGAFALWLHRRFKAAASPSADGPGAGSQSSRA